MHSCESMRLEENPERRAMKAVVTTGNGEYERLEYRTAPIPEPESAPRTAFL